MLTPGSVLPAPACAPGRPMERPIRVWSTMSALAIAATAFVLIFPIELPDKTFIATLVLATRYKPLAVWVGVTAAFLVQTVVACTLGGLLAHLPRTPVEAEEAETEHEFAAKARAGVHGWRAVGASFLVLFVAEWGDLSQLLTAGLVVRYNAPVPVGIGAFLALATVSALGAVLGRTLLKRIRLGTLHRVGAGLCLLMFGLTALQVAGVDLIA